MQISELARMADTTVRTVRHYHHVGLLPVPTNPGTRDYDFSHLARLMHICWLVGSGVPLAEVANLLPPAAAAPGINLVADDLEAVLADVDARIAELQAQREQLALMLTSAREGRGGSPLPKALWQGYQHLEAEADEATRPSIVREREMLEAALLNRSLPPWALAFGDDLGVDVRRASVDKFAWFAALPQMDEVEFERQMPALAQEHLEWILQQPWLERLVSQSREQFSDEALVAQILEWCDAAYPHPHHRRYLRHSVELMAAHLLTTDKDPA